MKPVDQEIVARHDGDCLRACYASLLDLPLDAVPNFIRHKHRWFLVMNQFLWTCGWEFVGTGHIRPDRILTPNYENSVNGFVRASVSSRVFEGGSHAVVIACNGLVVHDPSPYKYFQGENIINSGEIRSFDMLSRRTDTNWKNWLSRSSVTKK